MRKQNTSLPIVHGLFAFVMTGLLVTSLGFATPAKAVFAKPNVTSISGCKPDDPGVCSIDKVSPGQIMNINGRNLKGGADIIPTIKLNGVNLTIIDPPAPTEIGMTVMVPNSMPTGAASLVISIETTASAPYSVNVVKEGGGGGGNEECDPLTENCDDEENGDGGGGSIRDGIDGVKDRFDTSGKLTGSQTLGEFISNIIDIILGVVLAVAILFLIIGGYLFITSAGNETQAKRGRQTITYAVLGIVIIMLAYTIVFVVNEFILAG